MGDFSFVAADFALRGVALEAILPPREVAAVAFQTIPVAVPPLRRIVLTTALDAGVPFLTSGLFDAALVARVAPREVVVAALLALPVAFPSSGFGFDGVAAEAPLAGGEVVDSALLAHPVAGPLWSGDPAAAPAPPPASSSSPVAAGRGR